LPATSWRTTSATTICPPAASLVTRRPAVCVAD
jgi:hypothetical protein